MEPKNKALNLKKLKTYSLEKRKSKVNKEDFSRVSLPGESFADFLESFPGLLAAADFRELVKAIAKAHKKGKPVLANIGAHVVKCGLSPIITHLIKEGIFTAISMNGATSIHDFEVALAGKTSEDVDVALKDGSFGMAEETSRMMNKALQGVMEGEEGMGKLLGKALLEAPYQDLSILATALKKNISATIHIAIGTDIIHQHASADGKVLGEASLRDFRLFCSEICQLGDGGVVLNFGSAVIFPEVFLKALNTARNLEGEVKNFTTANFDMIKHYRALKNIVERPVSSGGKGYYFIGHHEIMIPLLSRAILEEVAK